MLKVNLSRLDSMIRVQQQERQDTLAKINSLQFAVYGRIYAKTDNGDMEKFAAKARSQRERFFGLAAKLARQDDYIAYLRKLREEANIRSGVSRKLQEKAALEEKIAGLRAISQIAAANTPFSSMDSVEVDNLKNADFYKSAFTESSRIFDLTITVLLQADLCDLSQKLEALQARLRSCADELASLNQETLVEIEQFETVAGG
ncbi:MAG: hypothetical protein HDQ91_06030 [Desulfovibrio sp.]|nr:hypothetical protein [Desulfovibrio sp.]